MLAIGYYDLNEILSPEVVKSIKDTTREWSAQMIKLAAELCENIYNGIMQAAGGTLETGGASTSGFSDLLNDLDLVGNLLYMIPGGAAAGFMVNLLFLTECGNVQVVAKGHFDS